MTDRTPEYEIYHQKIVEILVEMTGEENRYMWDQQCEYTQEFEDGESPEVVAQAQIDAIDTMDDV